MGCSICTREDNTKNAECVYDNERIKFLERSFKGDTKLIVLLVKVQSVFRGILIRKQMEKMKSRVAKNCNNTVIITESESNYTTFIEINTDQIVS